MKSPLYIGLGGVAGSGKDTFYSYLKEELNKKEIKIKRYSFGDELKKEVNEWTMDHYGINSLECTREEKEVIRPFLVTHGSIKRNKTKGQYWIKKVSQAINGGEENPDVICVTDVRYNHYDNDEASWIKSLGGILVYVGRIVKNPEPSGRSAVDGTVFELKPKNTEEKTHDPKVRRAADYTSLIRDVKTSQIPDVFQKEIKKLIKWIKEERGPEWTSLLT
jgi:hypothetical protein